MKYLKLFESFSSRISENLQYHIDNNNKPIVENVFILDLINTLI